MLRPKIPATVVTGFLGAGKTSLIRHLLETARGRRVALVVNEFGDVGVDGELLRACGIEGCGDGDIVELASRRFRDAQGDLNRELAAVADRVVLVVAGLPLELKAQC